MTLKLGTIDKVNPDGLSFGVQAFVDNIPKVSGGRLKVEVVEDYGGGAPTADADLIKAIAEGKLDGGWVGTRGFGAAGIHGLEAFEAPMVITLMPPRRHWFPAMSRLKRLPHSTDRALSALV